MKYKEIMESGNPSQCHSELNDLLLELESISPRVVVEIGSHRGGSLRVWRDSFHPDILIGVNERDEIEGEREGFQMVFGLSQLPETIANVKELLGGEMVDFLFIDGSHYYNDVKADFEVYKELVRPGGVVAFHDVILRGNDTVEVYKLWEEITKQYKTRTISYLDQFGPSATGCGVVYL